MPALNLPYQPIRSALYTEAELFGGFDAAVDGSFARTRDFAIYQHFIATGGATPADPLAGMMRALHDGTISQALHNFLGDRPVVAVMGGHRLKRDSQGYRDVATLARGLAHDGFLVATGGGPGAMEAAHLGARLAAASDATLASALDDLAREPSLPDTRHLVAPDGTVNAELVRIAQAWSAPAHAIAAATMATAGQSIAVPTWHFGHEPSTPFATHLAKYFQNSIREDGLLAIATRGIVFTEGRAGTIQEVFQDAGQNYYHSFGDRFSPMVFLGDRFWRETLPVDVLLEKLFAIDGRDTDRFREFERHVLITDDIEATRRFLSSHTPRATEAGGLPSLIATNRARPEEDPLPYWAVGTAGASGKSDWANR